MLYLVNSIAPKSGEYNAYASDGELVGTMVLDKGAVLPPNAYGLGYYEFVMMNDEL